MTIFLLGSAHSLNHSLLTTLPPLLPLIVREIGMSLETVRFVAALGCFLYDIGALVGGIPYDKISEKEVIVGSLALSRSSTVGFSTPPEILGFGTGLLLVSESASPYHPAANSLPSKQSRDKLEEAMCFHGIGGNAGQALAPSIAAILDVLLGWRYPSIFFGILCLLISLALWSFRAQGT